MGAVNYYVYLSIQLLGQIAVNVTTAVCVSKIYPAYTPRGTLPKENVKDIIRRVRDLFSSKLSSVIFNYADTIVISAFMGLTVLAVYQNYFLIINSLRAFIEVFTGANIVGIGNSLVTESREKNYGDLEKITMMFGWAMAVSSSMLMCMYQPFMRIWMGEENLLAFNYVVCFVIYFYSMGMNKITNTFKDAAGIWNIDRLRPLTAALVNLGLNLATVRWLGLYGVLLSSIVSIVLVQIPWLFHNLFRTVFPREFLMQYVRLFLTLTVIAALSWTCSWFICRFIRTAAWPTLIISAGVSFVIPNIIFLMVYGRSTLFCNSVAQIKRFVKGKIR